MRIVRVVIFMVYVYKWRVYVVYVPYTQAHKTQRFIYMCIYKYKCVFDAQSRSRRWPAMAKKSRDGSRESGLRSREDRKSSDVDPTSTDGRYGFACKSRTRLMEGAKVEKGQETKEGARWKGAMSRARKDRFIVQRAASGNWDLGAGGGGRVCECECESVCGAWKWWKRLEDWDWDWEN